MFVRWTAGFMAVIVGTALLTGSAGASVKGRRNTMYGLGAATIYSLGRHNGTQALILGGATYYSYSQYKKAVEADRRKHRRHWKRPYGWDRGRKRGWNDSHPPAQHSQQAIDDWKWRHRNDPHSQQAIDEWKWQHRNDPHSQKDIDAWKWNHKRN